MHFYPQFDGLYGPYAWAEGGIALAAVALQVATCRAMDKEWKRVLLTQLMFLFSGTVLPLYLAAIRAELQHQAAAFNKPGTHDNSLGTTNLLG